MKTIILIPALFLFIAAASSVEAAPARSLTNLREAIKGETTASAKYAAYAKKAIEEGYPTIALLFKATSRAEAVHAANHRSVLKQLGESMPDIAPKYKVGSTKENLQDALKGESYEVATMYPQFIKAAQSDKMNLAVISMNYAFETEKKHKSMFKRALDAMASNTQAKLPTRYYVCPTCGNTYDAATPERCGICMTGKERFITIE